MYCLPSYRPRGKSHGGGLLGKIVTKNLRRPRGNMGFWILMLNYQFHKDVVLNGKDFVMQYENPDRS